MRQMLIILLIERDARVRHRQLNVNSAMANNCKPVYRRHLFQPVVRVRMANTLIHARRNRKRITMANAKVLFGVLFWFCRAPCI